MSLDLLNSNGCGVCTLSELITPKTLTWWEKLLIKFRLKEKVDPDKIMQVRCTLDKKIKKTTDLCMKYNARKQIKIFGALKDESIPLDLSLGRAR